MHCMKCGTEISEGQVFCERCLLDMQTRPVKPGTVVTIPSRPALQTLKKPPVRKKRSPEEQAFRLRKIVIRLRITVVVLLSCLILVGAALLRSVEDLRLLDNLGKNYSTVTPENID